ncbi:unnamed protein product, partial [Prorocentrum cordatum]
MSAMADRTNISFAAVSAELASGPPGRERERSRTPGRREDENNGTNTPDPVNEQLKLMRRQLEIQNQGLQMAMNTMTQFMQMMVGQAGSSARQPLQSPPQAADAAGSTAPAGGQHPPGVTLAAVVKKLLEGICK